MAEPNTDNENENILERPEVKQAVDQAVDQAVKEATAGLVAKRDELLDELKKLKARIPEDFSADEYIRLKEEAERRAKEDAEKKGEWDKLREQMVAKHQKAIETKDAEIARMKIAIEKHLVDAAVSRAIADAKGNNRVLFPHVKARVKVVEANGDYSLQVIDEKGNGRIDEKGNPLSLVQLVDEFKQDGDFKGTFPESSGGGATGNTSVSTSISHQQTANLSPVERLKVARRMRS